MLRKLIDLLCEYELVGGEFPSETISNEYGAMINVTWTTAWKIWYIRKRKNKERG